VKDALNNITQYQYDANGNLTKVIDAKGNATNYTYDSLNRLIQISYADGTSESYEYWADGKLKTKTDGRGWKTYFFYDSVGRLMHKLYDNGTGVGYNYDAVGRMTSEYDLTWTGTPPNYTITWTGNTITYQYDAAGRLTKKTLPNGRYIAYTYDSAGRRTQMTDYFGGQTNYSYDALGRLTSLTNPFGEVTTFQYDANSRLIRKNLANGTYTTYSYNSRGFLTGIYNYKSNGTLITYATYTYDAVGNRLSMSTPEGNYSYSYDAIYRLTGEVNPIGGTYSYTYDAVGNRLSMTHNGQTINYVYDAGNKLLQAGNTTFTYDGNGNMVSKTENGQTTTYVYNYEDKMVQVNLPNGSSIVYSYDHSGKRIAKTAGGTTIDYYFDGDDLVTEAQGANILAYYTQGPGLISQRRNNASYFYHYDGLGSTKALTDANQNIQNTTKYDAWGNILQVNGTITNPYLYVGELGYYGDGDAGMYLLTQRWYNPVIGRFVVRDPISKTAKAKWINRTSGTLASYIYGANNPTYSVDPTALTSIKEYLEAWNQCMKDAREEYERCACYFKGTQAPPELLTLGCATLCTIPCSMLKGPAAGACVVWCTAICKTISQIGGDWAASKIASLFLGICNDIYNQLTESCHIAFWFCRERVYGR